MVVEGLDVDDGEGVGLAARAGAENATIAANPAAPTTGAASSSSLRLRDIATSSFDIALGVRCA